MAWEGADGDHVRTNTAPSYLLAHCLSPCLGLQLVFILSVPQGRGLGSSVLQGLWTSCSLTQEHTPSFNRQLTPASSGGEAPSSLPTSELQFHALLASTPPSSFSFIFTLTCHLSSPACLLKSASANLTGLSPVFPESNALSESFQTGLEHPLCS